MKNYYDILGVSKNASSDEIKRAYRKMAMKYHPDRQQGKSDAEKKEAEDKFKEVNEAYDVLSDPQKKEQYDHPSPFGNMGGMGGGNYQQWTDPNGNMHFSFTSDGEGIPPEFMNGMGGFGFRGFPGFGGFGRRVDPNAPRKGENLLFVLDVGFMEAIDGCTKRVRLNIEENCDCAGGCEKCQGSGRVVKPITIEVKIPRGCPQGQRLRVAGQGNKGYNGGPSGDIYFDVNIGEHETFVRRGFDLAERVDVPFETFILGGKIKYKTLTGEEEYEIQPHTHPGKVLAFKGKGSPIMNSLNSYGDLQVVLNCVLPASVSRREREILEEYRNERIKNGK